MLRQDEAEHRLLDPAWQTPGKAMPEDGRNWAEGRGPEPRLHSAKARVMCSAPLTTPNNAALTYRGLEQGMGKRHVVVVQKMQGWMNAAWPHFKVYVRSSQLYIIRKIHAPVCAARPVGRLCHHYDCHIIIMDAGAVIDVSN